MPSLATTRADERNRAVANQYGARLFTYPAESAIGANFPGNQVVMASAAPVPGQGATPFTHEARLGARVATPLPGVSELTQVSFNVFLRPTQQGESRAYGIQSFLRLKNVQERTQFRHMSPSSGVGELYYWLYDGLVADVGETGFENSGGQMFSVSVQALTSPTPLAPAVFQVSGYSIPATPGAFTIAAGNITRVGNALPIINGTRITEAQLGTPTIVISNATTAAAVSVTMSGAGFADFSTTASTTPIRARIFADGIWEEYSIDLASADLSGAFDITTDAAGQDFAEALAQYEVVNGQVPTIYLAIYGEADL